MLVPFRGLFPLAVNEQQVSEQTKGRIPPVTLECMEYVRRKYPEAKISVEIEKPGREGLQGLAGEADVVFYSKSWANVGFTSS